MAERHPKNRVSVKVGVDEYIVVAASRIAAGDEVELWTSGIVAGACIGLVLTSKTFALLAHIVPFTPPNETDEFQAEYERKLSDVIKQFRQCVKDMDEDEVLSTAAIYVAEDDRYPNQPVTRQIVSNILTTALGSMPGFTEVTIQKASPQVYTRRTLGLKGRFCSIPEGWQTRVFPGYTPDGTADGSATQVTDCYYSSQTAYGSSSNPIVYTGQLSATNWNAAADSRGNQ